MEIDLAEDTGVGKGAQAVAEVGVDRLDRRQFGKDEGEELVR